MAGFGTIVPAGIYVRNNVHDADIKYGPWSSIEEFKSKVPVIYRKEGLRFGIVGVGEIIEYQFVGGREDHHIMERFRAAAAYVSFWISPPVNELVSVLPTAPTQEYRVLHGNVIKEFRGAVWVDLYGGTGIPLQNGMAVIVKIDGVLINQIYVYNVNLLAWENKTQGIVLPQERFLTGFVDERRVARDVRLEITDIRHITSSGLYYINNNISNLPASKGGAGYLLCIAFDVSNIIYIYYDDESEWVQRKVNNVFSGWVRTIKHLDIATPTLDGLMTAEDKVKLDGISKEIVIVTDGDLNLLIETGQYFCESPANAPFFDSTDYLLQVFNPHYHHIFQILNKKGDTIQWYRTRHFNTWTPWMRVITDDNIATPTLDGLMTAADKVKLDGFPDTAISGQTLRYDGSDWVSDSNLFNDGNNIGIGVSILHAKLNILGGPPDLPYTNWVGINTLRVITISDDAGNRLVFRKDTDPHQEGILRLSSDNGASVTDGYTILSIDAPYQNPKEATLGLVLGPEIVDFYNMKYPDGASWGFKYIRVTHHADWRDFYISGRDLFSGQITHHFIIRFPSGNVGIGTTTPSQKLDVAGNIAVSGNINGHDITTKLDITIAATGTQVAFINTIIYNTAALPGTGNITHDLVDARLGIIQKLYHNAATVPTFPASWVKLTGEYKVNVLNIIYAEWCGGTRVEYWIIS